MRTRRLVGIVPSLLAFFLFLHSTGLSAASQDITEQIVEIAVHGNLTTEPEEIAQISGLSIGSTVEADTLEKAKRQLDKSGKFVSVEVVKRYKSITDSSQVAVVITVHERNKPEGPKWLGPLGKIASRGIFFPILRYADGYGITYGARISTVDTLGLDEHWSFPLTWGATHSAGVEVSRTFKTGPVTELKSRFDVEREINPRFQVSDRRISWDASASRSIGPLKLASEVTRSAVRFDTIADRLWKAGGTVTLDLRGDPAFPANGIYASGGWRAFWHDSAPMAGIAKGDLRGYVSPVSHLVLAGRLRYEGSSRTLPNYERLLVGGADTLRGYRVGTFDGDRAMAASAEARVLLPSPVRFVRLGVTAFMDVAKTYDAALGPAGVPWYQGAGAGMFLISPFMRFNLHFAEPLDGGQLRTHVSFGFTF